MNYLVALSFAKPKQKKFIFLESIRNTNGLSMKKPSAAFYAFPKIHLKMDDKTFAIKLLEEEGVAVVHGSGFDMPEHFRIVYLAQEQLLNEALDKIESFVKRNRG